MTTPHLARPAASQKAIVEAALLMLQQMGLSAGDLVTAPQDRPPVPTFAEYVPVVSAAVTDGTRRAYGSYWNRILDHWGERRLDEIALSEIRQLMSYVKTHVVARRNARGGRSATEHLVAALRCLYKHAEDDGLITPGENPARKVDKPRRLPSTRRAVTDDRLAEICQAAADGGDDPELDTLLLRLHTETACRRGGALALRPDDLDSGQCLIRLREKGETVRWQPVSPTLMARLIEHGQERHAPPGGQLLRYRTGRPITSRRYDGLWARIGRVLPWVRTQQISMHWIRHTTLTWVKRRRVASDATFREKREDTRPALQLPRPSQRAGRVGQQSGGDLRCHHPVASSQTTLHPLLLHPATRMMRQMQRKAQRRGRMPLPPAREAQVFDRVDKPLPTSYASSASRSPKPTQATKTAAGEQGPWPPWPPTSAPGYPKWQRPLPP